MASIRAQASGLWSDPATWAGGVLPGPGDEALANGFTVEIDQDIVCDRINTENNKGSFVISSIPPEGRTVTADVRVWNSNTSNTYPIPLLISAPTGHFHLVGTVTGLSRNRPTILVENGIDLTFTGTLHPINGIHQGIALSIQGSSNVVFNGDLYQSSAGADTSQNTVNLGNSASTVVNGSVYGTPTTHNASRYSSGTIYIQGGALTITGNVYAGNGPNYSSMGIYAVGTPTIDVHGDVHGAGASPGIISKDSGVVRVRGNLYQGTSHCQAVVGNLRLAAGEPHSWQAVDDDFNDVVLTNYTENSPPPAAVRQGYVYGPEGSLTGTAAVPPPEAVRSGTDVDGQPGTAVLSPAGLWEYEVAPGTSAGSRLLETATPASTGAQLKGAFDGD